MGEVTASAPKVPRDQDDDHTPEAAALTDVLPRDPTGAVLARLLREQFPLAAPDQEPT